MEKGKIIQEINDMLNDMDDSQLMRCYDYVTNEHDEENHEEHLAQTLIKVVEEKTILRLKCEGKLK